MADHCGQSSARSPTSEKHAADRTRQTNAIEEGSATSCISSTPLPASSKNSSTSRLSRSARRKRQQGERKQRRQAQLEAKAAEAGRMLPDHPVQLGSQAMVEIGRDPPQTSRPDPAIPSGQMYLGSSAPTVYPACKDDHLYHSSIAIASALSRDSCGRQSLEQRQHWVTGLYIVLFDLASITCACPTNRKM